MARRYPEPFLGLMHDYANIAPGTKPAWGPVDSWMWWGWNQIEPAKGDYTWEMIDNYLDRAATLGKQVALSIIPYPGFNQDTTPKWVYASIGGAGWAAITSSGTAYTYPRWNDGTWDAAFKEMIAAFGTRYDGDKRLHSVWIATLLYGETVTTVPGGGDLAHNPVRFINNCTDWYAAAFPTTPLFIMATGTTERKAISERAWNLGIDVKFNGLCRDARNQVQLKPIPGSGLMELAQEAIARGRPTAWEHAYNGASEGETCWAMLTGLVNGMTVLDLPEAYLDTLAAIPNLWNWTLDIIRAPQDCVGMWIARNTQYPTGDWEHGWSGPWERNVSVNAICYAPGTSSYKAAPAALTGTLEGYGGIGYCADAITIMLGLPPGLYDLEITLSDDGKGWREIYMEAESPGTVTLLGQPCWVHRVTALPAAQVPEPPEPEPPDHWQNIDEIVAALAENLSALAADQASHEAKLGELEAEIVRLSARLAEVEALDDTLRAHYGAA